MEEERKIRNLSILSIFVGVLLSLVIVALLRTTVVSDKIDYEEKQVQSLICIFEKVGYQAKDVVSNATLERFAHVNVTTDSESYRFFTHDVSQVDFVEMGIIHLEDVSLFAISSRKLDNNTKYVVEDGRIIELSYYGLHQKKEPCVQIGAIRNTNWLDETILAAHLELSAIIMFLLVLITTLFALPFAYHFLSEPERPKRKRDRKQS